MVSRTAESTAEPLRVLLVDDNEVIGHVLVEILRANRLEPVLASSAEDALRIASTDPPDVMVVDQGLPGLMGSDLIRIVRASEHEALRTVPIVGLSGRADSCAALVAAGASTFVRKPFRDLDLVAAIRAAAQRG